MESVEKNLEELKNQNLKQQQGVASSLRSEKELKVFREKLDQVIFGLQKRWNQGFSMKREEDGGLVVMRKKNKITHKELEGWAKEFMKNCQKAGIDGYLTELKIDLNGCGLITDAGIKNLSENLIDNLQNITILHLNFSGCTEITDTGMKSLSEHIAASLKNLTYLDLSFAWSEKITNAGVESLSDNIAAGLKDLTTLSLDFRKCDKITDTGLERLGKNIAAGLVNLTTLYLNFSWCGKITEVGMKSLCDNIAASPKNLTCLSLGFSECFASQIFVMDLQTELSKTIGSVCIY